MTNPLWAKYGLEYRGGGPLRGHNIAAFHGHGKYIKGTPEFLNDCNLYDSLVFNIHDSVADYLEANPDEVILYSSRTIGHMYFDIAEMVAKKWLDEACAILDKYGMLYHPKKRIADVTHKQ